MESGNKKNEPFLLSKWEKKNNRKIELFNQENVRIFVEKENYRYSGILEMVTGKQI